jgi:hypothetical protein
MFALPETVELNQFVQESELNWFFHFSKGSLKAHCKAKVSQLGHAARGTYVQLSLAWEGSSAMGKEIASLGMEPLLKGNALYNWPPHKESLLWLKSNNIFSILKAVDQN